MIGKTLAFFIISLSFCLVRSFTSECSANVIFGCVTFLLRYRTQWIQWMYANMSASVLVYFCREKAIINKTISLNEESQCQTLNFFMFHNPVLDEWFSFRILRKTSQKSLINKVFLFLLIINRKSNNIGQLNFIS